MNNNKEREVFLYDHVRTPRGRGRPDGALHEATPLCLATTVLRALRERNGCFDPALIDEVGLGIVMPVGEQGADLTRFALLQAGYGETVAGYQLNRFCTSGLDTVRMGQALIAAGQAEAAIGGGVESLSRVPIGSDGGAAYCDPALSRRFPYIPNGVAADLMAALAGLDRVALDAYALQSQQRAALAHAEGRFAGSLQPVYDRLGQPLLAEDEALRPDTSPAGLARLPPAFAAMGAAGYDALLRRHYSQLPVIEHVHTSGNSSGIVDGACSVLLGSEAFGREQGLTPRARIVGSLSGASEPLLSLGGPMPVTERLLARLGLRARDIDLFEVNEAFAVVPLVFARHFDIDLACLNVNGGSIALGHPLGATGAMLLGTLVDELARRGLQRGLVTLCAAAGQATAMVVEHC